MTTTIIGSSNTARTPTESIVVSPTAIESPQVITDEIRTLVADLNKEYIKFKTGLDLPVSVADEKIPGLVPFFEAWSGVDTVKLNALKKLLAPPPAVTDEYKKIIDNTIEKMKCTLASMDVTTSEKFLKSIKNTIKEFEDFHADLRVKFDLPTGIEYEGTIDECSYWKDECGNAHRDGDRPAFVYKTGRKCYYFSGIKYREVEADGTVIIVDAALCALVEKVWGPYFPT